ncbi:MAG TPA: glycosyltransferase family 2 protein [Caulobacteraceae bacterium]|jgi:dolichol-phosphate mannosyltransferase
MSGAEPALSVVAPCYNEEGSLPEFVRRTAAACEAVVGDDYELILVNDGSRDSTWACIRALASGNPRIVGLNLSRNHGHQLAVTAGLARAAGARVMIIDADLQDPPELLGALMARMDDGADVVFARRRRRASESVFKLITARLFYRLLRLLSDVDIPENTGDFRLLSRRIVDRLNEMPEQDRFLRGMVAWLGGVQAEVSYDRDARFAGKTNYTLGRMVRLAIAGVTSFSTWPLRLAGFMAGIGALSGVGLAIYVVAGFLVGRAAPGWTSLALIMIFFATVQFACLGVMGAYLGRIFMQVKGRPLYLVDEEIGGGRDRLKDKPQLEAIGGSR